MARPDIPAEAGSIRQKAKSRVVTFRPQDFGTMTFGTMTFGTMTFGTMTFGTMIFGTPGLPYEFFNIENVARD